VQNNGVLGCIFLFKMHKNAVKEADAIFTPISLCVLDASCQQAQKRTPIAQSKPIMSHLKQGNHTTECDCFTPQM